MPQHCNQHVFKCNFYFEGNRSLCPFCFLLFSFTSNRNLQTNWYVLFKLCNNLLVTKAIMDVFANQSVKTHFSLAACGCHGVTDQSLDLCDCAVDQLYSDCHQSVVTTILCDCGVLAHLFDPGLSDIPNGVEVKSTWLEVKCPQNHNVWAVQHHPHKMDWGRLRLLSSLQRQSDFTKRCVDWSIVTLQHYT